MFPSPPVTPPPPPPPFPPYPALGFLLWSMISELDFVTFVSGQFSALRPLAQDLLTSYDVFPWLINASWFSYARKNWLLRVFFC